MSRKPKIPVYWQPQPGPQTRAATSPIDETFYGGTRGGGKLSDINSLVCTPKGWRKIGELQPGDTITDPTTGGTCKVLLIHPQGIKDIYEVTTDDGAVMRAGLEHLWSYKLPNHLRPGTKKSLQREFAQERLGASTPDERWFNLRVGTTADIIQHIEEGFNPRIPLTEPVLYTVNGRTGSGELDPYLMGAYLGDGSCGNLTITSCDDEIRLYLVSQGWGPRGEALHSDGVYKEWGPDSRQRELLDQWLRNNGLRKARSWEKFIPEYVFASPIEFRLSFLQGLMDTDGYADERGRCYFTSTSRELAEGVRYLVWGLGGKAWIRDKHPTYTHKGELKDGRLAFDVLVQLRKSSALFRLSRKKERCTDSWNGGHEMMREIVSVKKVFSAEAVCITVDSPYGLYLADDFIVTHNSDCAIGRQIRGATKHGLAWNGIMFRRKYKDLGELKRRFDELILKGMPAERRGGDQQTNFVEFKSGLAKGAKITLTAIQRPDQIDDWLGHQFTEVSIEEAPQFSFLPLLMDKNKGSIRSPHGVKGHLFLTGNPGGPGAGTVKLLFIDPVPWGTVNRLVDDDSGLVTTRVYIHSVLEDNQILVQGDPDYKRRLMSIQDPVLRAAWVEGRWDIYIGQAFHFSPAHHVIPKDDEIWPIPEHVPIYMTFDWGFGAPFSIGWWWVDDENRLYRFGEWYGWDGKMPNKGARLTDPEIALGILQREKAMGILGRKIIRLSGRDCFNRKPNYLGGGQGPSTFNEFNDFAKRENIIEQFGTGNPKVVDLNLMPGDPSRPLKIRQFRNRLLITEGQRPMLVVYESTCRHFIRTIPSLCLDEINIEDLEEHQEDHCYDSACLVCMARPLSADLDDFQHVINVQKKTQQIKTLDNASREAAKELFMINKLVAEQSGYEDQDMAKDLALNADVFGMGDADNLTADDIDLDAESMLQEMPWLRNLLP